MRSARLTLLGYLLLATAAANAVEFTLGPVEVLPDTRPALPIYQFIPDGQFSVLPDGDLLQMYWPGGTSYRALGKTIREMADPIAVLEPGPKGSIDNGGAWLFSVFRQSEKKLLGFYHAEDHEFAAAPDSHFIAWKSIVRCSSDDNGNTWTKDKPIINSAEDKPAAPTWGGCGDFCVVRDEPHRRWLCYYAEHYLKIAASDDADGKSGTWKKYFDGDFQEPGLRGRSSPLPGLMSLPGSNPSVVFSKGLKLWLMAWHRWDDEGPNPRSLYVASSADGLHWASPRVVIKAGDHQQFWYPSLLPTDDPDGRKWWLTYGFFPDAEGSERKCMVRSITFQATPADQP